jgi:hypothetical protein
MSSISISSATSIYGKEGYRRIYKYANDFGDKRTHTDYKRIPAPGHPQEQALFSSPHVHNVVLVYDDGKIHNNL